MAILANLSRSGPVTAPSLEALCLMRSITLPLVRARGRALHNCVRTVQGQSECFSIGEKPSGSGRLRARRRLFHWRGPPKAPRQWQSRWIAHAPRANRFAVRAPVRAPKAEQWQSTRQSASKDGQATGAEGKGERSPLTFPLSVLPHRLVKGLRFALPFPIPPR